MKETLEVFKYITARKKELNAVLLAHNYQIPAIQEISDYCGDSLQLAKISSTLRQKCIVFCGVMFMAETAKILSPKKKVLIPAKDAGCPLADKITVPQLWELKDKYPDAWVVSYVNTSAEIKALSDVCCTSSNAVTVVKNVPSKKIVFIPDKNLGWWVKQKVPEKEIITWPGYCYVHEQFTLTDVEAARKNFPEAVIIVHPECRSEVLENADEVVSTSGMIRFVNKSEKKVFIIGTEVGLIQKLQRDHPDKEFLSLGTTRTCINMKKTSLSALEDALRFERFEVRVPEEVAEKAYKSLEEMVKYI